MQKKHSLVASGISSFRSPNQLFLGNVNHCLVLHCDQSVQLVDLSTIVQVGKTDMFKKNYSVF